MRGKLYNEFTANIEGKTEKEVTCEHCKEQYVYLLERKASGFGISVRGLDDEGAQDRARIHAEQKLQNCFDNDYDLVPCPACGAYQSRMVASLRRSHKMWIWALAMLLALSAVPIGLFTLFRAVTTRFTPITYGTLGVAICLIITPLFLFRLHRQLGAKYDPNAGDPEPRKQIAQERALLVKDLERDGKYHRRKKRL